MPKYRIEYGSTYTGGESGEDVIDAPSIEAAWDVAMSRSASMCCFYSAEPAEDEARLAELTNEAKSTAGQMVNSLARFVSIDAAKSFNNALDDFCLKYIKENQK